MRKLREICRELRLGNRVLVERAEWSEPLFVWGAAVWNPREGKGEVRPENLPQVEALLAELESLGGDPRRRRRLLVKGNDKGGGKRPLFGAVLPRRRLPGVWVLTPENLPAPPYRLVRDFSLLLEVAQEGYRNSMPLLYAGGGPFSSPPVTGAKEIFGDPQPPPKLLLARHMRQGELLALLPSFPFSEPVLMVENLEPLLAPGLESSLLSLVLEGKEGSLSPPGFSFALYLGDGRFAPAQKGVINAPFAVAPDLDPVGLRIPLHGKDPLAFQEGFLGLLYPPKGERQKLYARLSTLPLLRRFEAQLERVNVETFLRAGEPFASLWEELKRARVAVPQEAYLGSPEGVLRNALEDLVEAE